MGLPSTLFCLLLSVTLVSGHLHPDDRTIRWPRKGDPEEGMNAQTRIKSRQHRSLSSQKNHECQEGNPLGVSYSGEKNVTASGRTCQAWAASQPHQHSYTDVGEHNNCRNRVAKCHRYGRYICVNFLEVWGKILECNIRASDVG